MVLLVIIVDTQPHTMKSATHPQNRECMRIETFSTASHVKFSVPSRGGGGGGGGGRAIGLSNCVPIDDCKNGDS